MARCTNADLARVCLVPSYLAVVIAFKHNDHFAVGYRVGDTSGRDPCFTFILEPGFGAFGVHLHSLRGNTCFTCHAGMKGVKTRARERERGAERARNGERTHLYCEL